MFAAYKSIESEEVTKAVDTEFLQNPSFNLTPLSALTENISSSESDSSSSSEDDKAQKSKSLQIYKKPQPPQLKPEIFYIVKEPRKEYLKMDSLPYRALPFYRLSRRYRLYPSLNHGPIKFRRYFKTKKAKKIKSGSSKIVEMSQEEEMRIYLSKNPNDVPKWIEFINYKELTIIDSSDKIEKMKLEIIEKALYFNSTNIQLMEIYLETIPNVFTSDDVMKRIQDMISKDQYNLFYWKHYLKNSLSSMACDAEKGLKEFELAMNQMRRTNDSDFQILQLYKLCCLFLKQAGLNEQFFALIHLMMSVNINASDDFDKIFYTNEVQNPHLLEYEELVLSSDLPMNELWYRMESIRCICNFLPVRVNSNAAQDKMQDPQRYVFNEDICNLVNPLKNALAYRFDLFIITLKLLKFPLTHYEIRNEIHTVDSQEIECGMNFLPILLERNVGTINFDRVFFSIVKDLNVSPNYLSFNVEYEPFLNCILKILETCSNSFTERQNKLVLILWLRLQRLMIVIDKLKYLVDQKVQDSSEFSKYKKQIKSKVKNILKNSKYQNDLNIYIEYALIESALGDEKSCDNILNMAMNAASESFQNDTESELQFYSIAIEYCERKLMDNDKESCFDKLKQLAGNSKNIFEYFSSKVDDTRDESSDEIEDYFLPMSNKLNVIKAKVYHLLVAKSRKEALSEISKQIEKSKDGSLLREKLFETYIRVFHMKINEEMANNKNYMKILSQALLDFPKNYFFMHTIASQTSLRWFDVRKLLLKTPTNESIFYLLVASKYREEKFEDDSKIYQHRIYNTIESLMNQKVANISSLLTWRIYLRTAFNYDFSKCKRILYESLDRMPMIKQLYLDGSRFLPEDHSKLHDLIIEKGLRFHAIVEELEILRNNSL